MTGCRTHGDLVGPYVLGALEPDEVEAMTQHLAGCDRCAQERRQLAGLPALLDTAHAEDEIADPSPQLEEAVLDQFVRERARAARPPRSWKRIAIPAAAAATVILAVVLALLLPGGGGVAPTPAPSSGASPARCSATPGRRRWRGAPGFS